MSYHSKVFFGNLRNIKLYRRLSNNVRKVDEFTLTSHLPFQSVPRVNLYDRIWVHSSDFKDQVALVSSETNKFYTFLQLQRYISNFGTSLLKKFHLQSDDIVVVALPNCPEYPVVALGSLRAGCIITLVNPAYKSYELAHQLTITKPKVVATIAQAYPIIAKALNNAQIDAKIIIIDNPTQSIPEGAVRYSEIAENGEADYSLLGKIEKDHDDVAIIPFSSGTTGLPKGVEITYKNIIAALDIITHKDHVLPETANGTDQEIVPCVLPFCHIYGLVITLIGHLSIGAKLITMSTFDPIAYIRMLHRERASLLFVVPPLVDFLAKHPLLTQKSLHSVKYIFSGAGAVSVPSVEAVLLKSNSNAKFLQGYATTETTSVAIAIPKQSTHRLFDSCGDPAVNIELRLCDPDTGKPVPIGQTGEVCIRSPVIAKGYYQNEQATKECMTSDGFYKSGDMGVYKPGVGLYILDRIKELIKVKGMQVAPSELENLLRTHPSVEDAGVIGIPQDTLGEAPKAYIVAKKPVTSEEIKEFVSSKLAAYKRLHEVVFVDGIPRNLTGKILRKELRNL